MRSTYIVLLIIWFNVNQAFAQKSLSEQIDVVRPYKPVLADAVKINTNPEIGEATGIKPDLSYDVKQVKLDSGALLSQLAAREMKQESISKLYNAYLKGGLGNYNTTFGELYITNTRSRNLQAGVHAKHHASAVDDQNSKLHNANFSRNEISVFGKRIFTNNCLNAGIDYERDVVHFYGSDKIELHQDIMQRYNFFAANVDFESNKAEDSTMMQYALHGKTYSVTNLYEAKEQNASVAAGMFRSVATYPLSFTASFDLTTFTDTPAITLRNHLFTAGVFYKYADSMFSLTAGLRSETEYGSFNKSHLYPHLSGEYHVAGDLITVYAGLTGKVKKNSLKSFYLENPFIDNAIRIRNTNEKMELFGGLKGNFGSILGYRMNLSYYTLEDFYFFNNHSAADAKKFQVLYAPGQSNLLNFSAEVSVNASEKARLFARADFYKVDMDSFPAPAHYPLSRLKVSGTYNIGNKFLLSADVFNFGARKKLKFDSLGTPYVNMELPAATDINIGIDYRYSKMISIFLKLNNLANTKYEYWEGYKHYGFNMLVGASLSL